MKRSTKKGFTIVELVIVIAIIAILAAVLIPTFASLIQKANESKDTQLVKNLNTALAADNKEHKTMTDALDAATDFGYDVGKINASATGNEILWDSKNDVFCYLKDGKVEYIPETSLKNGAVAENETYKLWKIYTSEAKIKEDTDANKYFSIYWNSDDDFTAPLTVGFDAGNNTAITALTYKGVGTKQEVVIRTKGGTLTVNAPADTVNHYGYATVVTVTEVAKESYHENGKVDEIKLAKGRVVVESDGEVGSVMVTASAAAHVKVENKSGKLGGVAASNSQVASNLKNQVTGVDESKVLTTVVDNSKFAGGLGTEDAPYLIATAEQFANVSATSGEEIYFKQISDIVINNPTGSFAGIYDGSNYKIKYEYSGSNGRAYIFDSINAYSVFKNIRVVMGKTGVSLLRLADWNTAYGATFDHITFDSTENLVKVNANNFGFIVIEALYTGSNKDASPVYTFSNITNNVNIQNEGTCTGFIIGSGPCFNVKTTVNYENCVNNGTITGSASVGFLYGNSAYIDSVSESNSKINVSNCKNNGVLMALNDNANVEFAPRLAELNEAYQETVGGTFLSANYLSGKTITINQNGIEFSINTTDANVSYKLAFNVAAIYTKKDGKAWTDADKAVIKDKEKWDTIWDVSNGTKYLIDLPVKADATGDLSNSFKAYDKKTASANGITATDFKGGYAMVTKDGVTYLVFDVADNVYIDCDVNLRVYAYDAIGNLRGIANVK